ncbi:FecR family protein [Variovorax sp. LT1R16]|uniref:FecR family protein n=1 Tax=Variovorax sp. LT1R16 TaxID=3443728 RepID=UPI003F454FD4
MRAADPHPRSAALDAQAQAWVRRLASGAAKPRDARALKRWCETSEAHAQAFRKAHGQWRALRPAAVLAGQHDPELARLRAASASSMPTPVLSRRRMLGGAMAFAVTGIGVALVVKPPLALWPSVEALRADIRTGVGEQRRLALAPSVTVDLNTRSSLGVRAAGIELIDGEVSVDAARAAQPFTVSADQGRAWATDGRFEMRRRADGSCVVTCLDGRVQVAAGGREATLRPSQQITYDSHALGAPRQIDAAALSPWREGVLSFRNTALNEVVAEINRYRPGRVLLLARALGDKPVSGRFVIADLDKALVQIQRLFRLERTALPGGIVLLG